MPYVQIKGKIVRLTVKGDKRRKHLAGVFQDETGTLELKWFQGLKWIMQSLKLNTEYVLFGKPSVFNGNINIIHPELEIPGSGSAELQTALQPVYPTTEKLKLKGLDSRGILKIQRQLQQQLPPHLTENLPADSIKEFNLINRALALRQIHFPDNLQSLKQAELRLKFEEFFFIQLRLLSMKLSGTEKYQGMVFSQVGEQFNTFFKSHLPFPLTEAQIGRAHV